MKRFLTVLLALALLAGCASREQVPQASSSHPAGSSNQAAEEPGQPEEPSSVPEESALPQKPPKEEPEEPAESSSSAPEELEPWQEDDTLRPPLEGSQVPADTQSITLAAETTAFPAGEPVELAYTVENGSTQVLAYTFNYVVEWLDSDEAWQRVSYPEGQEPQADEGITVLEPGESGSCLAEIPAEMLTAGGSYRLRRGVWAYEYEVNTRKGSLPDEELGRFDVTLEFTVG